jgi:electron transport complex protein RnfA
MLLLTRRGAAAEASPARLAAPAGAACALLGIVLLDTGATSFAATVAAASTAGVAVAVALVLFAALRERADAADVPASFRGTPVALLHAAFVSLALVGVAGLGAH